jgi:hypothetical protein
MRKQFNNRFYVMLLVLLVVVFFWKIFLNPGSMLYSNHSDIVEQYSFWKYFIYDSYLQHGEISLWNPISLGGQPFAGNLHYEMWYPLFAVFLFSNPYVWFGYLFVLHILLGGIAAYFFMKKLKFSKESAFVSAIVYMFAGKFIAHVYAGSFSLAPTIIAIPLVFLLTEYLVEKKSLLYSALLGATFGVQFLAAHPQQFFYTGIIWFSYFVYRSWDKKWAVVRENSKLLLIIGVVAFLIAAIQLLPGYEFSKYSSRGEGLGFELASKLSLPPWELVGAVMPYMFGSPVDDSYFGRWNLWETNMYVGILPLLLAIVALIFAVDRKKWFFGGVAVFSVLFALGKYSPLFWFFYYVVPGFDMFRGPVKMLFFYAFAMCVLAGMGVEYLKNAKKEELQRIVKVLKWVSIVCVLGLLSVFLLKSQILTLGESKVEALYNANQDSPRIAGESLEFFLEKVRGIFYNALEQGAWFVALLFAGLCVFSLRKRISFEKLFLVVVVVIVVDLFAFGMPLIDAKHPDDVFVKTDIMKTLESDNEVFRVLTYDKDNKYGEIIRQNVAVLGRIQKVRGYDPMMLGGYSDYLSLAAGGEKGTGEVILFDAIKNKNMIDLLNVKYVVTNDELGEGFQKLKNGLYMNREYLPRAFVVGEYKVSEDILREMQDVNFDPRKYVLVDSDFGFVAENVEYEKAVIEKYSPNEIIVRVDGKGLLVLSENYYPGWKAYIDDEEVEVLKVNSIFRAVNLVEDTKRVVFRYEPRSFKIGKVLSIIGIIFVLVIVLVSKLKWTKTKL